MRITAGRLKGHPLIVPEGQIIRPTSDKVRQAIFNVLEHHDFGADFELEHSRVIDLFAGSGALGCLVSFSDVASAAGDGSAGAQRGPLLPPPGAA